MKMKFLVVKVLIIRASYDCIYLRKQNRYYGNP